MNQPDTHPDTPQAGTGDCITPGLVAGPIASGVGIPPGSLPGAHYVADRTARPSTGADHLSVVRGRNMLSPQVFRTRAVVTSGWIDLVVGLALVAAAAVIFAGERISQTLAVGFALVVLGLMIGGTGVGRILARLEVHPTRLVWTWGFSRHEVDLAEITEAALVEPGVAHPGGAFGGLLGGGLIAVAIWWVVGVVGSMFRAGPTLGTLTLIVLRQYGLSIRIDPIGTFSQTPGSSGAFTAQQAVQMAIERLHSPPTLDGR